MFLNFSFVAEAQQNTQECLSLSNLFLASLIIAMVKKELIVPHFIVKLTQKYQTTLKQTL